MSYAFLVQQLTITISLLATTCFLCAQVKVEHPVTSSQRLESNPKCHPCVSFASMVYQDKLWHLGLSKTIWTWDRKSATNILIPPPQNGNVSVISTYCEPFSFFSYQLCKSIYTDIYNTKNPLYFQVKPIFSFGQKMAFTSEQMSTAAGLVFS